MSQQDVERRKLKRLGLPYRSPYDSDFFTYAPFQKRARYARKSTAGRASAYRLAKKRTNYASKSVALSLRSGSYMPDIFTTNMRFSAFDVDTTAGGVVDLVFRGNSPYDPYFAAGGEEGGGFDELAAIYGKYKVIASSIRVTTVNLDSDDPVFVTIFPRNASTSSTTASAWSQPYAKSTHPATLSGGHSICTNYCTSRTIFGPDYSDKDNAALISTTPTQEWYWHVVFKNISANALNLQYKVEMTYRVMFYSRGYAAQT